MRHFLLFFNNKNSFNYSFKKNKYHNAIGMTLTFFYLLSSFCVRNKDYKLLSLKFLIKESYWEKKNVIDSKMLYVGIYVFICLCQRNLLLLQNIFIISPQMQNGTGTRGQGLTLHHNIGLTFEFENTCS